MANMEFSIVKTTASKDYELLDSGEGEKLERYGQVTVRRPDPQALWRKALPEKEWNAANAQFIPSTSKSEKSSWKLDKSVPEKWEIDFADLKFWVRTTSFKHTGIFPEQKANWDWIRNVITSRSKNNSSKQSIKVLNLFGYTGGATLAAAQAGAEVTHVDGSKTAVIWGRNNVLASELTEKPIRWIVDDVLAFVKREVKRGNKYDAIIMDPPAFGRGAKGEVWKIEDDLMQLLDACKLLLSDKPVFFLINGYASGYSALAYKTILENFMKKWPGTVEAGELTIEETKGKRLLPAGIFARWSSK
jgi:23S rRNA (cytosine1962-C5)-methyltransferase